MKRQVVIDFETAPDTTAFLHKMHNFGEDLWRMCKEDGWASITLNQVDRATNQLRVDIRSKRRVSRTVKMIDKLLEKHFLRGYARISEVAVKD